jgi:hypothetical protein
LKKKKCWNVVVTRACAKARPPSPTPPSSASAAEVK